VEYPAVLGSPVAGVVAAIGAGVSKVAVGDRVVCGTKIFSHKKAKYGGLQRFSVVDESEIVEVSIQHSTTDITAVTNDHVRLAT
jgi:NADPH:quinone reductase-like Zn-dependent oxidoreductase